MSSGIPLALTGSTLQAWLSSEGIKIKEIGYFTLLGLPYTIKFLWSPLLDRCIPPFLGRRRGWIFLTQVSIILSLAFLSALNPRDNIYFLAGVALSLAFFSASQDIVIDAYRTDVLEEKERGPGAGIFVTGYRIGMLLSGAVALYICEKIGWGKTYLLMAGIMIPGIIATLAGEEPLALSPPRNIKEAVILPLRDFFKRDNSLLLILIIILYKLPDAYAGSLTTAFLIQGLKYSPGEVGIVNKGVGLFSTIAGSLFGGAIIARLRLFRSMLLFGILQALSNLSFSALAHAGKNYPLFIFTVGFENFCGGMGTSSLIAFLMSICSKNYSATQYALLSSFSAIGRVIVGPSAGMLVEKFGWFNFFIITIFTALPGLVLIGILKGRSIFKEI